MKVVITIIIFLLLPGLPASLQNNALKFNLVKGTAGKPLGKVTAICQDKHGYIWLCGQGEESKCLYRYDGNRLIAFRHDNSNPNSLGGTTLETIFADAYGLIWIGFGDAGLDQFNPVTGAFKHYRHLSNDAGSLSSNSVAAILRDQQGRIWVGTDKGLDMLDEKTGKFIHYRNEIGNLKSLSCDNVRAIYQDGKGTIWIGTGFPFAPLKPDSTGGLNRMNSDGTFTRYLHDPDKPQSLINNKVRSIFEDTRGVFWIGTSGDGLHTMDREKEVFVRHPHDPSKPDKLSRPPLKKEPWEKNNDQVTFISEDSTGAIWIGTMLAGINRYDPVTKKITHYNSSNGFPDGTSWAGFTSSDGVVWIATQEDHLYRVDPFHRSLYNINTENQVNCLLEDKRGNLWVGTDGNGLLKYDRNKNLIRQFKNDPSDSFSIPHNKISAIFQNEEDTLWVGTRNGLRLFHEPTEKFFRFIDRRYLRDSTNIGFTKIFQDRQGIMWFGRWGLALTRFDPTSHSFKHYLSNEKDSTSIGSNFINSSIVEDSSGVIWAGGLGGINRLNKKSDQFKHYLAGTFITLLYMDSGGRLWAGSHKGLFSYDEKADDFLPFFDPLSEINSITVGGITEDNAHNLWLTSPSAIIKLNPHTKETFIYGNKFGILPNTLAPWTINLKNSRGEMLVGHQTGFYVFRPEELVIKKDLTILISDLFINNLPVLPGKGSVIQIPPEQVTDLELKYNQNNIAFNFAAIDYRDPESIQYFTMLEGNDNTWRQIKGEKSSYYFNLPRGKYIYRVKAFNYDGTKAEKEIIIRIHPPWWETWWAYSLYFVVLVTALWVFIRWRTRSLQKEKIILEEKVSQRTKELIKEKETVESTLAELKSTQAQLIQSEKMASLGELTAGIAHEIQNPLNFVNNFSEINTELIEELKNEKLKDKGERDESLEDQLLSNIEKNEQKINHHGKRADAIVKGMLQHSQTSTGHKEATALNALAGEYLRLSYHGLRAKDKDLNAALQTDFDEGIGKINLVPQDIGRVLLNLYNNAFYAVTEKKKQQPEGYDPTVSVSTKKIKGPSEIYRIEISVSDNGVGIPQKIIDKIFQPFFTTKPTGQGTGLGLSLAYDIIKAHGGEIKVNTKEGVGTVITIRLPA